MFSWKMGLRISALLLVLLEAPLAWATLWPWPESLRKSGVDEISVCGSNAIQISKRSFEKDVLIGKPPRGFVFSGLMGMDEYFQILSAHKKADATQLLTERFRKARLWEIDERGVAKDLGAPSSFEFPFDVSVKDCIDGAKTANGSDLSGYSREQRKLLCREKFPGPRVKWESASGDTVLLYSPDPSVRLKVPGERAHRYCNILQTVTL